MKLKALPEGTVSKALEKALRYRVLGEPNQAESICLDVLALQPDNQDAIKTLILALSDQFERRLQSRFKAARDRVDELSDQYDRVYHEGIVYERRARAQLRRRGVGGGEGVREWLDRAMQCYERAAGLAASDNPDPVLRYNTCVRMIEERPELQTRRVVEEMPEMLE